MADISSEDLIDGLRKAGMRITRARRQVCAVLAEAPGADLLPAPVEILECLVDVSPIRVSMGDFHRILVAPFFGEFRQRRIFVPARR